MTVETFGFLQSFCLVEWLIFGFIAANTTIAGVCVVHRSTQKIGQQDEH